MPLTRRVPKRGFTNPFRVEAQVVRLDALGAAAGGCGGDARDAGGGWADPAGKGPAKLLANGSVPRAVTVRGVKVSAGAREKIVAAGGRVERRRDKQVRDRRAWPAVSTQGPSWRNPIPRQRSRTSRKTTELKDKIVFTLLCLLIYRVGSHMTVPGVDVIALTDFFANQGKGGLLGLYDLFVGGGLSRATVFALGIMPYISASIFMQIAGAVVPQIDKMQKEEEGRQTRQSVDALHHRRAGRRAGVGLRAVHRVAARTRSRTLGCGSRSRWCCF